jgi:menaquinol-cytochrome c reductase iron-sulfur subunit
MSEAEKRPGEGLTPHESECAGIAATRRRFVTWAAGSLLALVAAVFGWSFVSALASRMLGLAPLRYTRVDGFESIPAGVPSRLTFSYVRLDAYLRQPVTECVWVIKRSPADAVVFSPICPHLGCRYDWHPGDKLFVCPCHNSVFDAAGMVVSGPTPRPLDTLPWKLQDGVLHVEWQYFKSGVPGKVRT